MRSALALAVTFAGLMVAPAAMAHAQKEATSPANGAVLQDMPDEIVLNFSEPTRVTRVKFTRSTDSGSETKIETVRLAAPKEAGPVIRLAPTVTGAGAYEVDWRAISADGHAISGSFSFVVTGN